MSAAPPLRYRRRRFFRPLPRPRRPACRRCSARSHPDTAGVTGTSAADSAGNTASLSDTDGNGYTALGLSTAGLTIGYWYNHQSAWPGATGSGKNFTANPVLIGDLSGLDSHQSGESTLNLPFQAAQLLINSSQSANDTRQIFISQALGAQLNIDKGAWDPGYDPKDFGDAVTGHDLISEAVKWLNGSLPSFLTGGVTTAYSDGTSGNVDANHNNIVDLGTGLPADFNLAKGAFTFEGNLTDIPNGVLASSSQAWHQYFTALPGYATVDAFGNPITVNVMVDGEGLKNALQAFNQDQLVVSTDGSLIGWNTGHGVIDVHQNGPDVFWGILHDQHIVGIT